MDNHLVLGLFLLLAAKVTAHENCTGGESCLDCPNEDTCTCPVGFFRKPNDTIVPTSAPTTYSSITYSGTTTDSVVTTEMPTTTTYTDESTAPSKLEDTTTKITTTTTATTTATTIVTTPEPITTTPPPPGFVCRPCTLVPQNCSECNTNDTCTRCAEGTYALRNDSSSIILECVAECPAPLAPNDDGVCEKQDTGLSPGVIAGIAVGCAIVLIFIVIIIVVIAKRRKKPPRKNTLIPPPARGDVMMNNIVTLDRPSCTVNVPDNTETTHPKAYVSPPTTGHNGRADARYMDHGAGRPAPHAAVVMDNGDDSDQELYQNDDIEPARGAYHGSKTNLAPAAGRAAADTKPYVNVQATLDEMAARKKDRDYVNVQKAKDEMEAKKKTKRRGKPRDDDGAGAGPPPSGHAGANNLHGYVNQAVVNEHTPTDAVPNRRRGGARQQVPLRSDYDKQVPLGGGAEDDMYVTADEEVPGHDYYNQTASGYNKQRRS